MALKDVARRALQVAIANHDAYNSLETDLDKSDEQRRYYAKYTSGNITSNSTNNDLNEGSGGQVVTRAGTIKNVYILVETNGQDSTDALDMTVQVKKNNSTAVCSTDPKIDKSAGSGKQHTISSGTGITQAVLKTDGSESVAIGDLLTFDVTLTRTTPDTEFADLHVIVEVDEEIA